jgi:hypothetical protein
MGHEELDDVLGTLRTRFGSSRKEDRVEGDRERFLSGILVTKTMRMVIEDILNGGEE